MSLQRRVASLERALPPSESLDPAIEAFLEGLETAELRAVLECVRGRCAELCRQLSKA
jgi:hypothetical protein